MVNQVRRQVVTGLALAGCVASLPRSWAGQAVAFPNSEGEERPRTKAPAFACDSHVHIYDDAYPVLDAAAAKPGNADIMAYRKIRARLGTTRTVVIQPANYKTDNRVTLAAISQLGAKNTRGIAVVTPDVTDTALAQLHAGGIRGIRFSLFQPTGAVTSVDMIQALAPRIHALGWHVQLQMRADLIVANADLLRTFPCLVVIDHMGRLPLPVLGSARIGSSCRCSIRGSVG
ncbi:amidohydrolase family protein [Burkholderia vietnamiensis]|uniref:amidohydrolase family protein n=1 Tax=Burkholderia vietnamiensis TaxID=60552 RepID=UPI000AFDD92F|nr:amidohydrolase family protein [Burkholderia vietnamiensis]